MLHYAAINLVGIRRRRQKHLFETILRTVPNSQFLPFSDSFRRKRKRHLERQVSLVVRSRESQNWEGRQRNKPTLTARANQHLETSVATHSGPEISYLPPYWLVRAEYPRVTGTLGLENLLKLKLEWGRSGDFYVK